MPNCGLAASQLTASCSIEPTSPKAFRRDPRAPEMIRGAPTGLVGKGNQPNEFSDLRRDVYRLLSEMAVLIVAGSVERTADLAQVRCNGVLVALSEFGAEAGLTSQTRNTTITPDVRLDYYILCDAASSRKRVSAGLGPRRSHDRT